MVTSLRKLLINMKIPLLPHRGMIFENMEKQFPGETPLQVRKHPECRERVICVWIWYRTWPGMKTDCNLHGWCRGETWEPCFCGPQVQEGLEGPLRQQLGKICA